MMLVQNDLFQIFPEAYPILARYEFDGWNTLPPDGACQMARTHLINDLTFAYVDADCAAASVFAAYPIGLLIDYLKRSHRYYTSRALPEIGQTLAEAIRHLPENHSLTRYGSRLYKKFVDDSIAHFVYEEQKLFTYAGALESLSRKEGNPGINTLGYSTDRFIGEHPDTELDLDRFVKYISRLAESVSADFALRILRKQLTNLRADMTLHSMIEDHVLVPKLAELERKCFISG